MARPSKPFELESVAAEGEEAADPHMFVGRAWAGETEPSRTAYEAAPRSTWFAKLIMSVGGLFLLVGLIFPSAEGVSQVANLDAMNLKTNLEIIGAALLVAGSIFASRA